MFRFLRRGAAGQRLGTFFEREFRPLKQDVRPATLLSYQGTVQHWSNLTSDPPLDRIDRESILRFRERLRDPVVTPPARPPAGSYRLRRHSLAGCNKHLRNLRAMLREAAEAGWIRAAPTYRKVMYRVPQKRPRAIEGATLGRIYHAAAFAAIPRLPGMRPSDWWRALIAAAICTGFRRSALLALEWDWIDLDRRVVHLPASADKCGAERVKPLHSCVVAWLVKIRHHPKMVFPWPHCQRTFSREWRRILRAGGIEPPVKFHDLKRTCGTLLASNGASVGVVQTMLDHASPDTSWRYYVDPTAETRQAVEAMPLPAEFLGRASGPPSEPLKLVS